MPQTILITGATGYIGQHITLQVLEAGHTVVASARSLEKAPKLRATLAAHLTDPMALERLQIVSLNLMADDGWDAAMQGIDVVMHTASPVPVVQPKDAMDIIRPARDGALRAVQAAGLAGVQRFIMTSSIAAIMGCELPAGQTTYDETCWTVPERSDVIPYSKSKTIAERAVWDWAAENAPEMQITMINPAFVMGPALDDEIPASLHLVERLMKATDPLLPNIGFTIVDVRDIALMHVRALERPESAGQRFIGADRFMWYRDMAAALRADHPDRNIPSRNAPDWLIRFLSNFDPALKTIRAILGYQEALTNARARDVLGIEFRDACDAVRATGQDLLAKGLV